MFNIASLQPLIQDMTRSIASESLCNTTIRKRRAIYDLIKFSEPESLGTQIAKRLIILTVKKVLPTFGDFYPADNLPNELVEAALAIAQETETNLATSEILEDDAENMLSHSWGYANMSWKPRLAANAAYYCLREIRGFVPFSYSLGFDKDSSKIWTDAELCLRLDNDAITSSAVAWACANSSERIICDKARLQNFWHWWLVEAIPQAVELANEL